MIRRRLEFDQAVFIRLPPTQIAQPVSVGTMAFSVTNQV
jgi:hypothetical protein